jgi:threonylcarbamoyladenosine tRNA methylthiotransferase MtaB
MTAQPPRSPDVLTFGCRLNAYESEIIRHEAAAAGLINVAIVNTCAVTAEAERQARQAIRRLRRESPDREIIVTGCAAQLRPETYAEMPEIDRVLGNVEKLSRDSYRPKPGNPVNVADIMTVTETAGHLIEGFDGRTRAFLEIQQGCDHRCTFCIIPFARGPNRSVPIEHVVAEAQNLVAGGYREIVLTGVDITAYGEDKPDRPGLAGLVRALLRDVPDLSRLRLSSLDPIEVDRDLRDVIVNEPRLMPHLHLSLQSGDDVILKRMKRRHLREDAVQLCHDLRMLRPDVVFGADLIVGFPTETEAMFENSLRLIDDCGLTYLHVFPYSARPGTPAARMPQVPKVARKERSARLRRAGETALNTYLASRIGCTETALIERCGEGRTEGYARVEFRDSDLHPGAVVSVDITGVSAHRLVGQVLA